MGFNVYGLSPKSEKGKYFYNNVWWWRPLAKFVLESCFVPQEESEYWGSNAGQAVSAETANHIAERLDMLLKSGAVKRYEQARNKYLESLPDEECDFCYGTGYRNGLNIGEICNRCEGKKIARPWVTLYPFSEENVKDFMEFCWESGGFEIW
jgi:hypothetical protein